MIPSSVETLRGWGGAHACRSRVYRPAHRDDVAECVADAARRQLTVTHRGAGRSYGDAALNQGGAVIDLTRLDRLRHLDPERGIVTADTGVTIARLWRETLPHGWWPPVVPGTMHTTLGGCVAMNVHGKNNAQHGPIGEHVVALTHLDADGAVTALRAEKDDEAVRGIVGAQGLTGTILDATLALRRVHSGYLEVRAERAAGLDEALSRLDAGTGGSDYGVGWIDCFAPGRRRGRGILHFARHLPPDHRLAGRGLDPASQALPARVLGIMPVRHVWRVLRGLATDPAMRLLHAAKYATGRISSGETFTETHAGFHFLLDYVPHWRRLYGRDGLLQYQFFVPAEAAGHALGEALRRQHELGLASYLGVLKRHRADRFAASYAVDGFSLALDFPVRPAGITGLARLIREFDAIQRACGGRVYAAKDGASRGVLPADRHPRFSSNLVRRWASPEPTP